MKDTKDGQLIASYVEEDDKKNIAKKIDAEEILKDKTTLTSVYYEDENGKVRHIDFEDNITVIYNGKCYRGFGYLKNVLPENGFIEALDNTGDGVCEILFVSTYKNIVVAAVDSYSGTIIAGSSGVSTTFLLLTDDSVAVTGTWIPGVVSPAWSHDKDITYVKSSMVGDKLSFTTEGSILGVEFGYNKNAMKFEVWVDGTKRMTVDPYYAIECNQLICDASSITFALSEGTHNVEIVTVDNEQGGNSELTLYSVVYGSFVS